MLESEPVCWMAESEAIYNLPVRKVWLIFVIYVVWLVWMVWMVLVV